MSLMSNHYLLDIMALHRADSAMDKAERRRKGGCLMREYWKDENGLTNTEFALLLALLVIAAVTAWMALGTSANIASQ